MYKGIMAGKKVYFNELDSIKYFDKIKNGDYKLLNILKSNQRSEVKLIEIDSKKLIYKIPTEKNTKKWQRFISLFRKGEAYREFESLEKIKNLNLKGAKPYFACEKKKFGMTVDSYIIMEYIEGKAGNSIIQENEEEFKSTIDVISNILDKIHEKGYLHGDSQLENFIIKYEEAYLIDTKLRRNIYRKFGKIYEYIYLEKSCHRKIDNYKKKGFYYKSAFIYNKYLEFWRKIRRNLKNSLRSKLKKTQKGDEQN